MIVQRQISATIPISVARTRKALGVAWVAFSAFSFFNNIGKDVANVLILCIGTLIVWTTAWALMENKRWGRLTIMGISALVNIDLAIAAFEIYRAPVDVQRAILSDGTVNNYVANPYHLGTYFGIGVLMLCLFSSLWLSLPFVRNTFDKGKRVQATRLQSFIACVLLLVLLVGFAENGLATDISRTVNKRKSGIVRENIRQQRSRLRGFYVRNIRFTLRSATL